ncbi:MAG: HEPN domain-containing protein [Mycobacterium sp.]|uniref:ApeA N-terminal domain 1-containing protein n=1 Tax=Mycobacterium sp. TaxID=1785 RepID=UPI003CC6C730
MQRNVIDGHWWRPSTDASDKVPGVLSIEPSGRIELSLIGTFCGQQPQTGSSALPAITEREEIPLVLGTTPLGDHFTLVDGWIRSAEERMLGAGGQRVVVGAARVIEDIHLDPANTAVFTAARVRIENLDVWSGFAKFIRLPREESSDPAVRVETHQPVEFDHGPFRFRIRQLHGEFNFQLTRQNANVVCPVQVVLEIEASEPTTCDAFDDAVSSWLDLVSFATRQSCAVTSFQLILDKPKALRRPVQVTREDGTSEMVIEEQEFEHAVAVRAHWNQTPQEPPSSLDLGDFAVLVEDRPLSEWYAAWMALRQDAHNALNILLSLTYGRNAFLQSDLLIVALGAETLHRDLYPDCLATYPKDFEAMMTKALEKLDEDETQWAQRAIRNEPSYQERLRDLATHPAPEALLLAVPDFAGWARSLAAARNGLAHGLRRDELKVQRMYNLTQQTRLFLELVVMAKIGVSATRQEHYALVNRVIN